MNSREAIRKIEEQIRDFTDIAVVGLSGGADSTLISCLCTGALGKENVYGLGMPFNDFDKKTFNDRSKNLAKKLSINYEEISIKNIAYEIDVSMRLKGLQVTDINSGNSRSRSRMCVLYGYAHALSTKHPDKRVRVIGTGNLSEDFIGYDTKGGDALADIFPIGELYKSEVYKLLDFYKDLGFIEEEHICKVPSAGLEDGQTDEKDLGYTYDEMEPAIRFCIKNYNKMDEIAQSQSEIIKFVWNRHILNKHKHEAPTVVKIRSIID